jgi:hypothetical protein
MPLGKNADAGDYVDDFKKSKAPQFKGKSDKKKRQMAIAAFLDARKKKKSVDESVTEAVVDFDSPGMMFKVSVEGLPDMFMAGRGPSDIKAQLRKIVKQPSMIQSVKRMPKTAVKKMFRDIFQGREEEE